MQIQEKNLKYCNLQWAGITGFFNLRDEISLSKCITVLIFFL